MLRLVFLSLLFLPFVSYSQVNIESQRASKKGFLTTLSLGSQFKRGNNNVFDLSSSLRLDHNTQSNHFFIMGGYDYGQSNDSDYKDAKFAHVRNTYMFYDDLGVLVDRYESFLGVEGFSQYQSDRFSDLKLRQLLGFGLRYEERDESTVKIPISDVLAFGVGGMVEYESLISERGEGFVFRLTNYASIRNIVADHSSYSFIAYYQPKVSDFRDFRILSELRFNYRFHKNTYITNAFKFNYDSRPPKGVEKYDLTNIVSLKLDW